jgi:hypothetical protein
MTTVGFARSAATVPVEELIRVVEIAIRYLRDGRNLDEVSTFLNHKLPDDQNAEVSDFMDFGGKVHRILMPGYARGRVAALYELRAHLVNEKRVCQNADLK